MSDEDSDLDSGGINIHSSTVSEKPPPNPEFQTNDSESQSSQSIVKWIVGFFFILQSKHHLPNSAIDFLIKFMAVLLYVLGKLSPLIGRIHKHFPSSLHVMRKRFADDINFHRYPICPKCNTLYSSYEECIQKSGSRLTSRNCNHIRFPNHPYQSRRAVCNTVLMKTVHLRSGQSILYPLKIYCYNGLKSTLQTLLMRPSFLDSCDLWKSRPVNNFVSDIYDGQVWKNFLNVAGEPFLQAPFTFGLMINIDWFQPYTHTHTVSSVGAIYLTIMNLPEHSGIN